MPVSPSPSTSISNWASQFAENFGNDTFARPEPRDYFLYACRWHDKGWKDLDDNPPLDPGTGLPYNLVETPIPIITLTGCRSLRVQ